MWRTRRAASPLEGGERLRILHATGKSRDRTTNGSMKRANDSSIQIAFRGFSIDRDSMGQQHRVRVKRKRRLAYLRRKKAALRAASARPVPAKQQAQKEAAAGE